MTERKCAIAVILCISIVFCVQRVSQYQFCATLKTQKPIAVTYHLIQRMIENSRGINNLELEVLVIEMTHKKALGR